ncbi:MAG TPA: glycosyltransferase family 4 protein [Candidatus Saccharimonadales bacterium]|nr:glycosyltransferase family 4 protein [Candidatus Saccharimonadales bacterium]
MTRKYPPSTGGMENAAFELHAALAAENDVTLVKWGGSNALLPVVYTWLFLKSFCLGLYERPDIIYLQDGMMAPLGWLLKGLLRRPTVMTVHGLEATYSNKNPLYRVMVTPYINRQAQLVAASNETKQTIEKNLPGSRPVVIFNGITDSFYSPLSRKEHLAVIAAETSVPLEELQRSKLLHTNGRLVRRKGVLWFVENVLPRLVKAKLPVLYFVSGEGKDRQAIEAAITKKKLETHVILLGLASDELRDALYNAADVFVMPNVRVPNDMEGFGLVALEAASCGRTVVASELEGIQDAIVNRQNGFLVSPGDAAAYTHTIQRELKRRSLPAHKVRDYTLANYSWAKTAWQYEVLMRQLVR